jgi:hypothetical protein
MQFIDPILRERSQGQQPTDSREAYFWLVDKVNFVRSCEWTPHLFRNYVEALGKVIEELYSAWLKRKGLDGESAEYHYMVLPYISFRFFNAPQFKEVQLAKVTSKQIDRLVQAMVNEFPQTERSEFVAAMLKHSARRLIEFIKEIEDTRWQ